MSNFRRNDLPDHFQRRGHTGSDPKSSDPKSRLVDRAKQELGAWCTILAPENPPYPIFEPKVRESLRRWMVEINSKEVLEAVKAKPRSSALLYGESGTGKTSWTHNFAARLGLPLAIVNSDRIIEKYIGSSAQNAGALINAINKVKGEVVVFLDEIDSIGTQRGGESGGSREREQALNVLMTGLEAYEGIWIAATNMHDKLDKALYRRFKIKIHISLPGEDERFAIIRMYADPFLPSDEDTERLVKLTDGASPALIKDLIESAKRGFALWPKFYADEPQSVVEIFRDAVLTNGPAPGQDFPPLWKHPESALENLKHMAWPWPRKGEE